jgi:hypothetical protein
VARTKLLNNTAVMTGRGSEGVVCDSGCGPDILTMRGNIIQAVHKVGYADHPFDEDHNLFWGGIVQFVASSSDLSADPRFVDVGHGNLHLRADSPAVDVGTETGQGADLDGARVPQDGDHNGSAVPDAGAYERHA